MWLLATFAAWPGVAAAQGGEDELLSNGLEGAPNFVRHTNLSRDHMPGHWPFVANEGELTCITVDGAALAFFKSSEADEPFMISENMIMNLIGKLVTGASGYIRNGYDPAKLIDDLERAYTIALLRCGPPYAQ